METMGTTPDAPKKCFCARCFLPVEADDKVDIEGQNFHRICSMCCICRSVPNSLKTFYGHVFCTDCFKTHVLSRFRGEQKCQSSCWAGEKRTAKKKPEAETGTTGGAPEELIDSKENSSKKQICARCLQMVSQEQQVVIGGQAFHQPCARCYCCHSVPKDSVKIYYGQVFCEECFNRFIINKEKDNPTQFYKSCFDNWNNNPAFADQMRDFMSSGGHGGSPLVFMMQGQQPPFCRCGGAEPQPAEAKKCKTVEAPCWGEQAQMAARRNAYSPPLCNGSLQHGTGSLRLDNASLQRTRLMRFGIASPLLPNYKSRPLLPIGLLPTGPLLPVGYLHHATGLRHLGLRCASPPTLQTGANGYQRRNNEAQQENVPLPCRLALRIDRSLKRHGSPSMQPAWHNDSATPPEKGSPRNNSRLPVMHQKMSLRHNRDDGSVRPTRGSLWHETESLLDDKESNHNGTLRRDSDYLKRETPRFQISLPRWQKVESLPGDNESPRDNESQYNNRRMRLKGGALGRETGSQHLNSLPLWQETESLPGDNESVNEPQHIKPLRPKKYSLRRDTGVKKQESLQLRRETESLPGDNESLRKNESLRDNESQYNGSLSPKSGPLRRETVSQHQNSLPHRHEAESMLGYNEPLRDNESHYNRQLRPKSGSLNRKTRSRVPKNFPTHGTGSLRDKGSQYNGPPYGKCVPSQHPKGSPQYGEDQSRDDESVRRENRSQRRDYESLQYEDGSYSTLTPSFSMIPLFPGSLKPKRQVSPPRRLVRTPDRKGFAAASVPIGGDTDSWEGLSARTGAETFNSSVGSTNLDEIPDVYDQEKIEKLTQYLHRVSEKNDNKNWKMFYDGDTGLDYDEPNDDVMLPDYNIMVPDYNVMTVPDYNLSVLDNESAHDYDVTHPDYNNVMIPDYNMMVSDYNTADPDYNMSIPDFNMDYNKSLPEYNITVPDYLVIPNYNMTFPVYNKVSNRGDEPKWRNGNAAISGWVDIQLKNKKNILKCPKCLWQSGIISAK